MFLFLDEAWRKRDDGARVGVIAGVALPRRDLREVNRRILQFKQKCLPRKDTAPGFELHGAELLNKANLKRIASGSPSWAWDLVREVLGYCVKQEYAAFGSVLIGPQKKTSLNCADTALLEPAYKYLFKRFNSYLVEAGSGHLGSLVFDDRTRQVNERIAEAVRRFLYRSKEGRSFDRIVPIPTFGIAKQSDGLQIADLVCRVLSMHHEGGTVRRLIEPLYERFLKAMRFESADKNLKGFWVRHLREGT